MVRVAIAGCAGRMGRTNLAQALADPDVELVGGCERPGHPDLGRDLGELAGRSPLGLVVSEDFQAVARQAEVVVEFSTPAATLEHAELCARIGCAHVIGTTGLDSAAEARLRELARHIPILWAPNMSQGVNLLLALVERVARTLDAGFDIEIVEMHHRHKVDAPSGTALALGRAAARGRGIDFATQAVLTRAGEIGPRPEGAIGFAVLRGGDVVGDHTVIFAGPGERIELAHRASDRAIYARGAMRAARWIARQPPGFYGMADVLGFGSPQ
ncbi:4-hydroxy-tetrahydrodipicolinate reductase [bacterium HR40]|nr:4-hydroxy-tetrahydrodipicolinate reductase [bacterium HR40]